MALFGKRKKAEVKKSRCCAEDVSAESIKNAENQKGEAGVKILGSGCAKCAALEAAVREAVTELGMSDDIEHVRDFAQIAAYGVMSTPALVVDGRVMSFGKVLKAKEAADLIKKVRG